MRKELREAYDELKLDENCKAEILDVLLSECDVAGKETEKMKQRKISKFAVAAAVAAVVICVPVGVTAAARYLSAQSVAREMGSLELANKFDDKDVVAQCQDGDYRFSYLGNASTNLKEAFLDAGETTYVALAIERIDGIPVSEDETFVASPLIQGLDPIQYNIYSMEGGATWKDIDGIRYMIMGVDTIEMFADKNVYLAITTGPDYGAAYNYDETTGDISVNDSFEGINALFKIDLDKSKADPNAQEAFLTKRSSHEEYNMHDPATGNEEFDYLFGYNYENLDSETISKIVESDVVSCLGEAEYKADSEGYYHIKYDNEFGGGEGLVHKEIFTVNRAMLCIENYDLDEQYIIFEYDLKDENEVLHLKHYKVDKGSFGKMKKML